MTTTQHRLTAIPICRDELSCDYAEGKDSYYFAVRAEKGEKQMWEWGGKILIDEKKNFNIYRKSFRQLSTPEQESQCTGLF